MRSTTLLWALAGLLACDDGYGGKYPPVSPQNPGLQRPPAALAGQVKLERVAKGLNKPVAIAFAPGDASGRMFVVEQDGRVRIVRKGGAIDATPFLDVSKKVSRHDREQGLLGLAFHPRYAQNGRFYLNYTGASDDNSYVVEYAVSKESPDRADPRSAREILMVTQNGWNHNGGHLAFGPDGKLYVGFGDGGGAGDQDNLAQDKRSHLGKMLRVDVDARSVKVDMIQWGHRNPWRYSFDKKTGDLYVGDVGQNAFEEVNVLGARDLVGKNLGWSIVEGMGHCFKPKTGCRQQGLVQPVLEYSAAEGCSVIGGYVYRGKALPALDGIYFYADFCSALVRSFRWKDGRAVESWDWRDVLDPQHKLASLTTFGEDNDGELYLASYDGLVYKLARR